MIPSLMFFSGRSINKKKRWGFAAVNDARRGKEDMINRETGESGEERPESQTAHGPGAQVFNEEKLLWNLGGDRDLVRCIVTLFLDDTPAGMERLKEALDGNDAAAAGRLAHKMKGAAANIRAEVLSGVLADIENAAVPGRPDGGDAAVRGCALRVERFRHVFREKADQVDSDGEG